MTRSICIEWALTLRNAGIGSGSIPAFRPFEKLTASGTKWRRYIMNPAFVCEVDGIFQGEQF